MRSLAGATLIVPLLVACQTVTSATRPPLETEGELYVYLQKALDDPGRLSFAAESVSVLRTDGSRLPLTDVAAEEVQEGATGQILLARGRLEPGGYAGLSVKIKRATLARADGKADLAVPAEAVRVEGSFAIARQAATVLWLTLDRAASTASPATFAPEFRASLPPPPVPALIGWVSSPGAGAITVFDRHTRQVMAVTEIEGGPSGVAIDEAQLRGYVAQSASDEVRVIDLPSGTGLARIRLRPGDRPRELGLTPDRRLLVSVNGGSDTVSFIDPAGQMEVSRVPTGSDPVSLLIDAAGRRAYVCNRLSNSITVLDLVARAVAGTIATEPQPVSAQLDRAGSRLYVIASGSPYLVVYGVPALTQVYRAFVGLDAAALKVDPKTDLLYLGRSLGSEVEVYDPATIIGLARVALPGSVSYMAIDDLENALLALMPDRAAVAVIDLAGRRLLAIANAAGEPFRMALAGERR
jgi:YVTN family beta-propeller protein